MRLFILYVKLLKVSNIHRQNKFVELLILLILLDCQIFTRHSTDYPTSE